MRFHRFDKYEFRDTGHKRATFARKQKAEREAPPLFADQVTTEQIDMDEETTARRLRWGHQQAADRKRRTDKWRKTRRRLSGYQEPVRGALLAHWQGCRWPADPSYFLSMLHIYDAGRLSLNIPKAWTISHILIDHLTQAASFYRGQLRTARRTVAYLKTRGLCGDIVARYSLDCAPAGFQVLREAFLNYSNRALEKARLVAVDDGGRHYNRFRDRIMFLILDDAGSVIGFGDRVLKGDGPKYLNSPETEVFQKGRMLFSLTQVAKAIAAAGTAYVMEGYLDVVSLTQHGMQNAVVTLGTATTGQHVERLLGLVKRMIFCFDGDDADGRATVRALDACLPHVTDAAGVSFLFLPRDHNPDGYVRAKGGDAFNDLALGASSLENFFLASTMQGCQLEYAEGRAQLIATAVPHLQQINAPAMLCRILTAIAGPSKFSAGELIDLCGLEENVLPTIDRQWFCGRIQLIGNEWTTDEPRKRL